MPFTTTYLDVWEITDLDAEDRAALQAAVAACTGPVELVDGFVQIHTDVWLLHARTATDELLVEVYPRFPVDDAVTVARWPSGDPGAAAAVRRRFEDTFTTFETGIDLLAGLWASTRRDDDEVLDDAWAQFRAWLEPQTMADV